MCLCRDQIQQRLSELWPVQIFAQHSDSSLKRKVVLFLAELRDSILRYREKRLCVGGVCVGYFGYTFFYTQIRVERVKTVEKEKWW